MSWTKHFKPVNSVLPVSQTEAGNASGMSRFSSWLPEVYIGPANRLQRYTQYEQMDFDHEVHSALDIIAEFSTQADSETNLPFIFNFSDTPSKNELNILNNTLKRWCDINQLQKRVFKIFRSTLKYGDQFFIRDPETFKLYWIDPGTVEKVVVNESTGKDVETYFIKDLDLNIQNLVASDMQRRRSNGYGSADGYFPLAPAMGQANYISSSSSQAVQSGSAATSTPAAEVDANNVVHVSLTEGMDDAWPFGVSELEKIYKVYKQKELLEESLLIYRVHRAPERRVFKIDTGSMSPARASQYIERIKNDVQQRRIPSKNGGASGAGNIMDSTYSPMCLAMDTRVPLLDGRTLTIEELTNEYQSGKENWAYSCDPITGKIVPGVITWAGVTRTDAEVIKIVLDNGEELTVTPDHKIPVLGKGFVEAQDLTVNDPLISFETREKSLSMDPNRSYTQVFDHSDNSWKYAHKLVAELMHDIAEYSKALFNLIPEEQLFELMPNDDLDNTRHNCRIVSIERLDNKIDVGTITIDGQEKYHKHHTFAIESGIFVKNSILEDYYFAVSSDGRGSSVDVLQGGQALGEIHDMKYWQNKMLRALGVPSSYLPTGPEDGTFIYNDGRVGTAFIQEFRFQQSCMRLQRQIVEVLDKEFKKYLVDSGFTLDTALFSLAFTEPQSFSEYRDIEINSARIQAFTQIATTPYISKRFALKKYLGWTEDEIVRNETMWKEETGNTTVSNRDTDPSIRDTGFSSGDFTSAADIGVEPEPDMGDIDADTGEDLSATLDDTATPPPTPEEP